MSRPEQTHRVEWQHFYEADPVTGRPVVKFVWPRYVARAVSSRFSRQELKDLALYLIFAIVAVAALFTELR